MVSAIGNYFSFLYMIVTLKNPTIKHLKANHSRTGTIVLIHHYFSPF